MLKLLLHHWLAIHQLYRHFEFMLNDCDPLWVMDTGFLTNRLIRFEKQIAPPALAKFELGCAHSTIHIHAK